MTSRSSDQLIQPDATPASPLPVSPPVSTPRPHRWEMMLHPFIKTLRFVNDLRQDGRISLVRKLLYLAPMVLLLLAVLLPEGSIAALIAVALPVAGPAINLPTDAVIDWLFLGIAAYALLGIFPRAVVAEHHARRFHPGRIAKQQRQMLR